VAALKAAVSFTAVGAASVAISLPSQAPLRRSDVGQASIAGRFLRGAGPRLLSFDGLACCFHRASTHSAGLLHSFFRGSPGVV
jgi:hypothetical protein